MEPFCNTFLLFNFIFYFILLNLAHSINSQSSVLPKTPFKFYSVRLCKPLPLTPSTSLVTATTVNTNTSKSRALRSSISLSPWPAFTGDSQVTTVFALRSSTVCQCCEIKPLLKHLNTCHTNLGNCPSLSIKGIVHAKIIILLSFTHTQVVLKLFFCWAQKEIGMLVTKQLTVAIDFHRMEKILSHQLFGYQYYSKYLLFVFNRRKKQSSLPPNATENVLKDRPDN